MKRIGDIIHSTPSFDRLIRPEDRALPRPDREPFAVYRSGGHMQTVHGFPWWDWLPPTVPGLTPDTPPVLDEGEPLPDPVPPPLPPPPPRDWRIVPMPARIAHLRRDVRGYPIFYAIQPPGEIRDGDTVDFRVLSVTHHLQCARERRCAICGGRVGSSLFWIGGPMCVQNRVFGDGFMHEECCRYSQRVCPYLTIAAKVYSDRAVTDARVGETLGDVNAILTKPQRICVYRCREYHLVPAPGAKHVYRVPPGGACEWYHTDGTYIRTTRPQRFAQ
jgi:hypothetical protein